MRSALKSEGQAAGGRRTFVHERRRGSDRRALTWRTFVQGSVTPRRRGGRRTHETPLIDWHEPHLMFLAVTILLLSVADAFLTLTLIARGATEANPLLAVVLAHYPRAFAAVKMTFTGVGVTFLVVMSRVRVFRLIRISAIMNWCLLAYVALIGYEAWLLHQTTM